MQQPRSVVTGAATGLGRAFCLEIARRGGCVLASDINLEGVAETVKLVEEAGGRGWARECDVRDPAAVEALAADARERMGEVDLLVNNAGVAVGGPMGEVSLEDWRFCVDINLWGVIHGCHSFVPAMRARGSGYIINVASAAGLLATPQMAPYNVTKAAVVALSETLHGELRPSGVHVTALCPTFFLTAIHKSGRGAIDERIQATVEKMMRRSKIQAPAVAAAALDGVERGHLYVLPMRDGRVLWRLKRAVPQRFYELLGSGAVENWLRKAQGR